MQYSVSVRNGKLDAVEVVIGSSPVLKIRSGPVPSSCSSQDEGSVLASIALPSDWMKRASNGMKDKAGTWSVLRSSMAGIAGHFRIYDANGICHVQGSVGITEAAHMQITNMAIGSDQPVIVERFMIRDNNF